MGSFEGFINNKPNGKKTSFVLTPGTTAIASAPTLRGTGNTSYTKIKTLQVGSYGGIVRVSFELKSSIGTTTAFGQIYINDNPIPVGIERSTASTTFVTYSEDIPVKIGDLVQLYFKSSDGSSVQVQTFALKIDLTAYGSLITD